MTPSLQYQPSLTGEAELVAHPVTTEDHQYGESTRNESLLVKLQLGV